MLKHKKSMWKSRWNLFQTAPQFCPMELWKQQGSERSNSSKKPRRSWAHAVCMSWFSSSCAFCVTETMHLLTIDTSLHCSTYWIAASSKTTTELFKGATSDCFSQSLSAEQPPDRTERKQGLLKKGNRYLYKSIPASFQNTQLTSSPLPHLEPRCALNTVFVFPPRLLALQQHTGITRTKSYHFCTKQKVIIKVHPKKQYHINQDCPQYHVPSCSDIRQVEGKSRAGTDPS